MKKVKIANLSMFPDKKTGYSPDESEVFEVPYRTPKRGFTTARLRATLGGFRINDSVVCPEPNKPKGHLTLTRREGDDIPEVMHNLVEALNKHTFGKETILR